jgi:hypothetical protein
MTKDKLPIGVSIGGESDDDVSVYIDIGEDATGDWAISSEAARELAKQLNNAADLVDNMKRKH